MGKSYKIPLNQYNLFNQYLFHSDTIKWTAFSIFAVMNGILISALIQSDITIIDYGKIVISGFGLGSTFAWLLVNGRNQAYLIDRLIKARNIEIEYYNLFKNHTMWIKRGKKGWINKMTEPESWYQRRSAEKVNMTLITLLVAWWGSYFTYCLVFMGQWEFNEIGYWTLTIILVYLAVLATIWSGYWVYKKIKK